MPSGRQSISTSRTQLARRVRLIETTAIGLYRQVDSRRGIGRGGHALLIRSPSQGLLESPGRSTYGGIWRGGPERRPNVAHGGQTAYCPRLNKDDMPTAQGARAWSQATVRGL